MKFLNKVFLSGVVNYRYLTLDIFWIILLDFCIYIDTKSLFSIIKVFRDFIFISHVLNLYKEQKKAKSVRFVIFNKLLLNAAAESATFLTFKNKKKYNFRKNIVHV